MDIQERDSRFFGIFGLILTVCGLSIPYIVNGVSGDDQAAGFAITTLIFALIFNVIGRKSKPGFVGLVISGIAIGLMLIVFGMKTSF